MGSSFRARSTRFLRLAAFAFAAVFSFGSAQASLIPIGLLTFDVTIPGSTAQFDIINLTGINASPPDFPVTTSVNLSSLDLIVNFSDGSSQDFGAAAFALSLDGLSFDGPTIAIGGLVVPISATLTGDLSPTLIDVFGSGSVTVNVAFAPASLTDPTGGPLQDGDFAEIDAVTGGGTAPEPGTLLLVGAALLAVALFRRKNVSGGSRSGGPVRIAVAAVAVLLPVTSWAVSVKLATAAAPSSAVAGVTFVNLTVTGLPATTTPGEINIAIAPTCAAGAGGPVSGEVDTTATKITTITSSIKRVQFQVPASLAQNTYFVSISGTATDGTAFASGGCAVVAVSHSSTTLNACLPTSSLAIALGTNVNAYVPNGWWGSSTTGVKIVPLEGVGASATIPTTHAVNSCASNPATGQTVCTANNTDIYLITGSTLNTTLTSGSNQFAGFSGGSCQNCGVAINALTNTAYVAMGVSGGASGDGVQSLNLNTNALAPPFPTTFSVSENISVDPGRNLVLSPGETNNYDLLQLNAAGGITGELGNATMGGGGEYDSAAEDCTTGVALAANEFSSNVLLADLNQATFVSGSPGNWTAPFTVFPLTGASFSAGTSGISVAPGGGHLGIVTGEFGGQSFAVFQLPSAPATGGTPPTFVDWAYVTSLPNTPDGRGFSAGFDPHTVTAYTSPNNGNAYGVIVDWATGVPTYLAVIDLQKILAAPRLAGTHTVDLGAFNLLGTGALRYAGP
jgi:hypothetical protein